MVLAGKTALVTGAANGIGKAISISLAQRKCNLVLIDVNTRELAETERKVKQYGINVNTYIINVTNREAIYKLSERVKSAGTLPDILINNAGVTIWGSFDEIDEDDFDWVFNVNFHGMVNMCRTFLPILKTKETAQIVNLSSIFGIVSPACQVAYTASKFAARGFSDGLREELLGTGIGVTSVYPGGISTHIAINARIPQNYSQEMIEDGIKNSHKILTMSPEIAGEIIVKAIIKRKKHIFVGNDAKMAALIHHFLPTKHMTLLRKMRVAALHSKP